MTANIEAKIASITYIPNGEVDDTRFEKLFDDLVEIIRSEEERPLLFQNGLLSALNDGMDHEDERNRALSIKLLGSLAMVIPAGTMISQQDLPEIERMATMFLGKWSFNIAQLIPMDLESIAFFLQSWIPVLRLTGALIDQISLLMESGLHSTSHFVRSASIDALKALCMRNQFPPLFPPSTDSGLLLNLIQQEIMRLLTCLSTHPGNRTLFDAVETIASSPYHKMLQGHSSMGILWNALCCDTDTILAEAARCCFRRIMEIQPELLKFATDPPGFEPLRFRLDCTIDRILKRVTRFSLVSCISLFEMKLQPSEIFANQANADFAVWCHSCLHQVLIYVNNETGMDDSSSFALCETLKGRYADHIYKLIAIDVSLSVLLKSSLSLSQWSELIPSLLQAALNVLLPDCNSNTPSTYSWAIVTKLCKLIISDRTFQSAASSSVLSSLVSGLLTCFKAPTTVKVAIIKAAHHLVSIASTVPAENNVMDQSKLGTNDENDWKLFDSWNSLIQRHFRFSHDWELRDCVIQLLGGITSRSRDLQGLQTRMKDILPNLVSGLLDANEHVRASTWEFIALSLIHQRGLQAEKSNSTPEIDFYRELLKCQPSLLFNTFCLPDSQSSSRVSQSTLMAAFLIFNDITTELENIPDFTPQFHRALQSFLEDDEWDVRVSILSILGAVISMEDLERRRRWNSWNCDLCLQTLLIDESREVKEQSWRFFQAHRVAIGALSGIKAPEEDEIAQLLSELTVDAHYHSDDEVYPLGAGVDANDLDCPY